MSLKSFMALADDKLHDVFAKKEPDHAKNRATMLKRLDTAANQFASATPTKGKKMFKVQNGVVLLTLPFEIGGKSEFHIPSERMADAIKHLKAAVEGGEADEAMSAGEKAGATDKPARAARKPRADAGAGWSDERRARFQASIAARNAAKQQ